MGGKNMDDREQMMHWINMVSFAVNDLILYLDTHPEDTDALKCFQEYKEMRVQALQNYAAHFGPLTIDTVQCGQTWSWVEEAWPWEGRC